MTRKERKELVSDIEDSLDDELDFELEYDISDYHENGLTIVDVDIYVGDDNNYDDNWDDQVDDIFASIVQEWGGWYSWQDHSVSISIPD